MEQQHIYRFFHGKCDGNVLECITEMCNKNKCEKFLKNFEILGSFYTPRYALFYQNIIEENLSGTTKNTSI